MTLGTGPPGPTAALPTDAERTAAPTHRIEALVTHFTLGLLTLIATLAAIAVLISRPHGSPAATAWRLAIPLSVVAVSIPARILAKRGRPRFAVVIVLGALYLPIVAYSILGGFGLHTYTLPILAVLIVVASLLIGQRAGLWATGLVIVTVATLYGLESAGLVVDLESVRETPAFNILIAHCVLFGSVAAVLHRFSKVFHDTLRSTSEQELRLRQLLDVAPVGYMVHRDDQVLMANRTLTGFTGHASPEEILGTNVYDLLPEGQRADARAQVAAACAQTEGRTVRGEHELTGPQGRPRLVESVTAQVRLADGPAVVTVLRDVTRERAAAAALAGAKEEADNANRAKSRFLANMSHEIRTPMNAVIGLTELLLASDLSGEQRERATAIRGSTLALLRVIDDILDVSRIEAGRVDLVESHFSPRALVHDVHQLLRPLADEKALAFVQEVAADTPVAVMGDEGRLRQVLVNLVANAIKFTAQGEVRIELDASAAPNGRSLLRFRVRDTGPGLSRDEIARLFAPFVQLDPTSTRRYGGAGLGLHIAREFTQLMGGRLEVTSAANRGSCFELDLELSPCAALAEPSGTVAAAVPSGARKPRTVLLVEDNELNRQVASAMLESAGHRVFLAGDGADAVRQWAAGGFDCVFMDCQMPVMDGMEATRRIRALEMGSGGRHTPIVALTATVMPSDREQCLAAGMDDFLAKPLDMKSLLDAVDRNVAERPSSGDTG